MKFIKDNRHPHIIERTLPTVESEMKKSKRRVQMKGGQVDYILLKEAIRIGENVNRIHIHALIQLADMVRKMREQQFYFLHGGRNNYTKMKHLEKMVDSILEEIPDLNRETALTQTSIINF